MVAVEEKFGSLGLRRVPGCWSVEALVVLTPLTLLVLLVLLELNAEREGGNHREPFPYAPKCFPLRFVPIIIGIDFGFPLITDDCF
jgi:hypothetical protein